MYPNPNHVKNVINIVINHVITAVFSIHAIRATRHFFAQNAQIFAQAITRSILNICS